MVVLDRNADGLERADRLVAQLGRRIEGRHREVAALVERLGAGVVLEEEVLELGADVERVEAHALHPVERTLEDITWVALVRLTVRSDDVADHPRDLRLALLPRHQLKGLRI